MINFQVFSVFVVLVVTFPWDQVLGEGGSGDAGSLPPECTEEFKKSKDHTMCKYWDDERVTKSGVSEEDKQIIVDVHNRLRGNVEPAGTDLSKLVWDDKIAAVADKWAKQCQLGHDKNRKIPSYGISIGQNAAAGYRDWEGAIMGWYNEVRMFKYGEDPNVYLGKDGWKKVGHYTQVVHNTAFRIGCGYAECESTSFGRYYVCNYGKGQNRIPRPYTKGERCSACPNSCKDGLCDCGGKMCLNHGKLDKDKCTCQCTKIYTGPSCEELKCPESDHEGRCWKMLLPKHCRVPWVKATCPYMCGVCGGPDAATPPPVFKSKHNCTYQGKRPSEAECSAYGDKGMDTRHCETRSGRFGCAACLKFGNVAKDFCPVMCGMCDGPCDGKSCKNRGKLNRETCECECPVPYGGPTCEIIHCPDSLKDAYTCWKSITPPDCLKFGNVPSMCPWMCGLCGKEGATPPPVFKSNFGCDYSGQRASKEECQAYGAKGADTWACATNGGKFGCKQCYTYGNVKTEYCPVMCGLCDP